MNSPRGSPCSSSQSAYTRRGPSSSGRSMIAFRKAAWSGMGRSPVGGIAELPTGAVACSGAEALAQLTAGSRWERVAAQVQGGQGRQGERIGQGGGAVGADAVVPEQERGQPAQVRRV